MEVINPIYFLRPKIAVTGHRPNKLWGYDLHNPNYIEMKELFKHILITKNASEGITAMALGVDQIFALAVLELKQQGYDIKLICTIPCLNHPCKWLEESKILYYNILDKADEVVQVSNKPYQPYLMQLRNEYNVDRCDELLAVYDGSKSGGTYNCIKYAESKRKPITFMRIP